MQTVIENSRRIEDSGNPFPVPFPRVPDPLSEIRKLKISEFKSWAVFSGIIALLTGALIYLKVGVTMETVTDSLFFLSLGGMIYSLYKLVLLSRIPAGVENKTRPHLN